MPRNRMIKLDFWSDEKIGHLSNDAKLLFIGLWNLCDDGGVARANPVFLRNNLFPYSNFSHKKIDEWLHELAKNKLIDIVSQRGEAYCIVQNFLKHQEIKKPSQFRYLDDSTPLVPHYSPTSTPLVPPKEKVKGDMGEPLPPSKPHAFADFIASIGASGLEKLMPESQMQKLIDDYGKDIVFEYLEKVFLYDQQKGKGYKNYIAAARSWLKKDDVDLYSESGMVVLESIKGRDHGSIL
jgi:hypothetical protein